MIYNIGNGVRVRVTALDGGDIQFQETAQDGPIKTYTLTGDEADSKIRSLRTLDNLRFFEYYGAGAASIEAVQRQVAADNREYGMGAEYDWAELNADKDVLSARDDILRAAVAKQRAALEANPGILEHELIDLIDPDKQ